MGRFTTIAVTTTKVEARVAPVSATGAGPNAVVQCVNGCLGVYPGYGAKSYYDGKQCWQYKICFDRPGSYCWQVPSNAVCVRTVLVGGGGKPKCGSVNFDGTTCNSAAGAGGAYSEKCHAVTPGQTYFCLIVGRQEQDTTLACNGTNVHTAGGAGGMVPGSASGGDWNSRGGCAGWTCNYCGGSYSQYCGSCKYFCLTNCCGYCIVYQYDIGQTGGGPPCCNILLAGGGSAGSPRALCGGCSSVICGNCWSSVVGGGSGIGQQCNSNVWCYNCCSCICPYGLQGYPGDLCWNYPQSAQGGQGSQSKHCDQGRSYQGCCLSGIFQGGHGGPGGPDPTEGCAWIYEYGYMAFCVFPYGTRCNPDYCFRPALVSPCRVDWWDITDICGSGSPGTVMEKAYFECACFPSLHGKRPVNSGEGAGTGGITAYCCDPIYRGDGIGNTAPGGGPMINWQKICNLGTTGQCDQAWLMQDALFPYFITCAGTLGGSGGVEWCGYASKAGKGGGAGQAKCQIMCVCYGGVYDCCNQVASTPLAFPPCILDMLMSNAGTGMAIIYYREA